MALALVTVSFVAVVSSEQYLSKVIEIPAKPFSALSVAEDIFGPPTVATIANATPPQKVALTIEDFFIC